MRSVITTALGLILFSVLLIASGQISEFHGTRQESSVVLEWATEYESSLKAFELQRSVDQTTWLKIGSVSATGNSTDKTSYSFIDNSVYKSSEAIFYYQIVMIDQSGQRTVHDTVVSVSGSSGIRHTWGSIKATFR